LPSQAPGNRPAGPHTSPQAVTPEGSVP